MIAIILEGSARRLLMLVLVAASLDLAAMAQNDELILKTTDGALGQPRLVVTSSTGTAHAEVRLEDGILRLSSTAPGTNAAAGDIRYDAGVVKYHDGASWQTLLVAGSYLELAPPSRQEDTGALDLIFLDENGGSSPDLMELEQGGVDRFVVTNSGQVRLLGGDLFTDRWTLDDTNTAIGVNALSLGSSASGTTAVGVDSLRSGGSGSENSGFGYAALPGLTTGAGNSAMGAQRCLQSNTSGNMNTGFGYWAGFNNQTGHRNCSMGYRANYSCLAGDDGTIIGNLAGYRNSGSRNVAIGRYSDTNQQAGSGNVSVGSSSGGGVAIHTRSGSVFIGQQAGLNEVNSNRLYIMPSSSTPLVYGEFDNDILRVNGRFEALRISNTPAIFDRLTDDGVVVSIQRDGVEEGTISVAGGTVSYNAFTGSHLGRISSRVDRGMLVSMTGENTFAPGSKRGEPIHGLQLTSRANDPAVLGAYLSPREPGTGNEHLVMAVGNGEMWVVDTGKDIRPGDALVSSDKPGCAMVDPGTFEIAHVVARAAQIVRWDEVEFDGRPSRRKKISVLFDRFDMKRDRSEAFESLDRQVDLQFEELRKLRERLGQIESMEKR